mmetsp:Transcript_18476/g.31444  ORF Transcript_18476/g.31444 Transcript_18476/m.31444 type:complete len:103 (+) Transcript_18476:486-794(+)
MGKKLWRAAVASADRNGWASKVHVKHCFWFSSLLLVFPLRSPIQTSICFERTRRVVVEKVPDWLVAAELVQSLTAQRHLLAPDGYSNLLNIAIFLAQRQRQR